MEILIQNVVKGINYGFLEKSFKFWFVSLLTFFFSLNSDKKKKKKVHTWIFFSASPALRVVAVLETAQLSSGRNYWTNHEFITQGHREEETNNHLHSQLRPI